MIALAMCAVVLLKIPMLSFFSSQLIEEQIQYIINLAVRIHSFVEN
jgi:hypothetical protein